MRRFLSSACFALGVVWTTAGAFKFLFGVQLTLPLLPPLGLERVAVVPSIAIGLVLFAVGAVLAKGTAPVAAARPVDAIAEPDPLLNASVSAVVPQGRPSMRQPNER
jgi:hypothetical protein